MNLKFIRSIKFPELPQLRVDLANHAVYGTVLYWLGNFHSPLMGLILAGVFAFLKDVVHDKLLGKGTFDPKDIVWTVAIPLALFVQVWIKTQY